MLKSYLIQILKVPFLSKIVLRLALKCHNMSYQLSGILASELEPDKLHPKHRLMKYHAWFSDRLKPNWDVLDIGCGNGALAYDIKNACRAVTGIDIDTEKITMARKLFFKQGIEYICADATNYDFKAGFQAIILSNVLEHMDHREQFLRDIYKKQKKDNPPLLLMRVPMITRDWITLYKKEKGVEWRLDTTHFTEYTVEQIFSETSAAGLTCNFHEIRFGEFYGVFTKRKND